MPLITIWWSVDISAVGFLLVRTQRPSFASTHLDEGFEPAGLSPFRASMRLPIVALLALLTTLRPDAEVNAQFNLRPVIEPYAQWPCSDWSWENCPQPVPHGGHTPAEWYEVTRWRDRTYGGTFGTDGISPGLDVDVASAQELYDALEDRHVARINVTKSFSLEFVPTYDYDDTFDAGDITGEGQTRVEPFRWPVVGYPVSREVTVRAGPQCAETTEGHCEIDVARATLFVVNKDGNLIMRNLRLRRGGGRLGAFMFMEGEARGDFTDVQFREGRYFPAAGEEPSAAGGAVMIGTFFLFSFRMRNQTDDVVFCVQRTPIEPRNDSSLPSTQTPAP